MRAGLCYLFLFFFFFVFFCSSAGHQSFFFSFFFFSFFPFSRCPNLCLSPLSQRLDKLHARELSSEKEVECFFSFFLSFFETHHARLRAQQTASNCTLA